MPRDRLDRERHTIQLMIEMFCRGNRHAADGLCADCRRLHVYAMQRIARCPYHEDKPTCARCTIHCYEPDMRESIRQVMRYSGPRMLLHRPLLAMQHYVDEITRASRSSAAAKRNSD